MMGGLHILGMIVGGIVMVVLFLAFLFIILFLIMLIAGALSIEKMRGIKA